MPTAVQTKSDLSRMLSELAAAHKQLSAANKRLEQVCWWWCLLCFGLTAQLSSAQHACSIRCGRQGRCECLNLKHTRASFRPRLALCCCAVLSCRQGQTQLQPQLLPLRSRPHCRRSCLSRELSWRLPGWKLKTRQHRFAPATANLLSPHPYSLPRQTCTAAPAGA